MAPVNVDELHLALRSATEARLLPSGVPVLVACSGGVDSMSLLHALHEADRWPLSVATVDHGLHPESGDHARFVVEAGARLGLEVETLVADPDLVQTGQGPEDAARRERYRLLERCAARLGVRHVVTAHTADDQAETALMRLALGAGTRGMAGIPTQRGIFVRPWLEITRESVLAYAEERGVLWREDPTNRETRFLRNRMRRHLQPALREVFGESWVRAAARTAGHLRGDLEAQDFLLARWREEVLELRGEGLVLRIAQLDGAPQGLRHLLLREAIEEAARRSGAPPIRELSTHVRLVDRLLSSGGGGRALDLPGGLRAERAYGRLRIGLAHLATAAAADHRIDGPGLHTWGRWTVAVEPIVGLPPPEHRGDGCVARSAAPFPWLLRRVKRGERFRPLGAPGSKRVSRLWTDARVSRDLRGDLPVLESLERLVWVAGLRIAHAARVQSDEPGWRLTLRAADGEVSPWGRSVDAP